MVRRTCFVLERRRWSAARLAGLLAGLALSFAAGCASPAATFHVHQPRLTGRQRNLTLTSDLAAYGRTDDGRAWHILVRFPLPGAATGRPNYLVYLHVPEPAGRTAAAYPVGRTAVARGFFYQRVGEGRGREVFTSGFARLQQKSPGCWELRLLGTGAVGTEIRGTAVLRQDDLGVRDYIEAHHPGDVADLLSPPAASQPARP